MFSCFPVSVNIFRGIGMNLVMLVFTASLMVVYPDTAWADTNGRPSDSEDVVLEKLFAKSGQLEANVDAGMILNQSYVDTTLLRTGITYYLSEKWGVGLNLSMANNRDRQERKCIETFYNDPKLEMNSQCASQDESGEIYSAEDANMGPAYVPVREIQQVLLAEAVYSPLYGKQIFFMGLVNHFDLQLKFGAGVARSRYYEQRTTVKDNPNQSARGSYQEGETKPGVAPDRSDLYGEAGRPEPQQNTNIVLAPSICQKFYFAKHFSWNIELGSLFLLGTPSGFDFLLSISSGASIRF
jgi:outer membrane beta-barrel protein